MLPSTHHRSPARHPVVAAVVATLLTVPNVPATEEPTQTVSDEVVAAALDNAVYWRGLDGGERVTIERLDRSDLVRMLEESPERDQQDRREQVLRAFGFVDPTLDLSTAERELMGSDLAGFFDPRSGALVVIDEPAAPAEEAMPDGFLDIVMVHEITHHIQHRHFDLLDHHDSTPTISDRQLALRALIEGDATHVANASVLGVLPERIPLFRSLQQTMLEDPATRRAFLAGLLDSEGIEQAPGYLREESTFPYEFGMLFVVGVRRAGGQPLLDHAFANPPTSTEQILHPEKWIAADDPPIELELPDFSERFGSPLTASGTWGEAGLRFGFAARATENDTDRRLTAAAGWGGDAFAIYGEGAEQRSVWLSHWDSASDAEEFAALAGELFEGWQVERRGERVVMLSLADATAADAIAEAVVDALFAVEGSLPDVAGATVAADPADRLALLKPDEVTALFYDADSDIIDADMVDAIDWQTLAEDPDVARELEEIEASMAEQLQAIERPPAHVVDHQLHVPTLGLELSLKGWTLAEVSSRGSVMEPMAILRDPFGTVAVVMWIPAPPQAPIEALAAGLTLSLPGYDEVGRAHTTTPREALDLAYAMESEGVALRVRHRLVRAGEGIFAIQVMTRAGNWTERHQTNSSKLFDAIRWSEPATVASADR